MAIRTHTARFTLVRMLGTLTLLALAIGTVHQAAAQSPAPPPTPAPGSPKLVGAWEGPFTTDGPAGTMSVVISSDAGQWKVTNGLSAESGAPPAAEPRDTRADGKIITWIQNFGDFEVHFKAVLNADETKLEGTLEAYQGGGVVGGGTFTLSRK